MTTWDVLSDKLPLEQWALSGYLGDLNSARRILLRPVRSKRDAANNAEVVLLSAESQLNRILGTMKKGNEPAKFEFIGWVNLRLEDAHKEEIEHRVNLAEPVEKYLNWIASLVYEGYSFSISWDAWSDAYQATLVCKASDDPNYGYGMSARHPDIDVALVTLHYKHVDMARGVWSDVSPSPRSGAWG